MRSEAFCLLPKRRVKVADKRTDWNPTWWRSGNGPPNTVNGEMVVRMETESEAVAQEVLFLL